MIGALARADEVRRPQPTMAQKRQGNRFAQPPRFDDPRTPPRLSLGTADAVEAMPAGRNFR
jgi:hypothetical protein